MPFVINYPAPPAQVEVAHEDEKGLASSYEPVPLMASLAAGDIWGKYLPRQFLAALPDRKQEFSTLRNRLVGLAQEHNESEDEFMAPSFPAINSARGILHAIEAAKLSVPIVIPTADGGLGLELFGETGCQAMIDVERDGTMYYLLYGTGRTPTTKPIPADAISIISAVTDVQLHCGL